MLRRVVVLLVVVVVLLVVGDAMVLTPSTTRRGLVLSGVLVCSQRASAAEMMCPRDSYCASSYDDASNKGRNFVEPWTYDSDWREARARLVTALDDGATVDDRTVRSGDDTFYFTPGDVTIQVHAVSQLPFVKVRLERLRVRCGFDKLDVLRNRRRTFLVLSSPFDSFGPSTLDPASLFQSGSRDVDPLSPDFQPPDAQTRRWLQESSL